MTPFKITAIEGNKEDRINPSLHVFTNSGKCRLAIIWADGKISFDTETDYEIEELKAFRQLSENFWTLHNTLMENQKLIHELTNEVQELIHSNPVIERQ